MIKCTKCGVVKDTSCFDKKRRQCKKCRNKRQVELRSKDRQKYNSALKKARQEDPIRFMLYDAKRRALKQGLPFDIESKDISMPTVCPILGIPLVIGEDKLTDNSPTLDKFVPALGYVKGNVEVISFKANTMKQRATSDEVLKLYNWMKQKENKSDNTTDRSES